MRRANEQEVLLSLIRAYEEEANLYAGLEDAAIRQREIIENGKDPRQIDGLVERQRELAEHIGRIEAAITPLRQYWEQMRDAAQGPQVRQLAQNLDRLLDKLAEKIHAIVAIERENSRSLLAVTASGRAAS